MAQPPAYTRRYNFTNFSTLNPSLQQPGVQLDLEFNALKRVTDLIRQNLALIQADTGGLAAGSVGINQFASGVYVGVSLPVTWVTGRVFALNDTCIVNGVTLYRCLAAHTAGALFATDLIAGKWVVLLDLSTALAATGGFASGTFTGDGVTTAFNLGNIINAAERVLWIESGVIKIPGTDYTVSGAVLTRLVAPAAAAPITWRLFGSTSTAATSSSTSVAATQLPFASYNLR